MIGDTADDPDFRAAIDWHQPWLASLRADGEPLCQTQVDWRVAVDQLARQRGLKNHGGQPISFVPQTALPAGTGYETFIGDTGGVPTRDNLHDFFNALIWLNYPRLKTRLNALQTSAQALSPEMPPPAKRGDLRDALTIFDENAVLVAAADPTLFAHLRAHQWNALFVDRRTAFGTEWRIHIVGHALLEKLVHPYKAITAHAWLVPVAPTFFELSAAQRLCAFDQLAATGIDATLRTRDFTPLPVLGVPDWWPGQSPAFYSDTQVFRPPRQRN